MSELKTINWSGVHAALDHFYATKSKRDAMLDAVQNDADMDKWDAVDKVAIDLVREAFYVATSDRNSRDTVMLNLSVWDAVRTSSYPVQAKHIPSGERSPIDEPWKG